MLPIINILAVISTYKAYILHNPTQYQNLTTTLLAINKQQIKSLLRQWFVNGEN